jgi:DNA-binding transcriptional MocR family regulator
MATHSLLDVAPRRCPKYLKLAQGFERQLRAGVLRVGDRLPSVRQLRDEHRVSVATAVGCYLWLERQGYVRARPKSGFYVSRTPVADGPAPVVATRVRGPVALQLLSRGAEAPAARTTVELGSAVVGPELLPMARLNRSIRIALSAFSDNAVRYEGPNGSLRLRRQLARLVFRQGGSCSPEEIVVTSGGTEALSLSLQAVARAGDVVAVESPCCYEILQSLQAHHLRAVEIPHLLHEGVDLGLVATALKKHRVKALLVNATCHNPLGDRVTDAKKAELVAFATRHELPIIEGDTFGDLVWSGERPRLLKSFDKAGVVMQCSTLAHYVAPGFNIGWASGGRWHGEVERLKGIINVAGARLPQLAMAEFLESGAFDKHLKRLRLELWRSVEASRQELLRLFPEGTRVSRPEGGFVLWIQLPDGHDGLTLQRRAAAAGVHILAGEQFSATQQYRDCIRIACGHPFEVIRPALRTLAGLLQR